MKKVLINQTFVDRVTHKEHVAGQIEDMTEARIAEITAVNPKFITVINSAETVSVDSDKLEAVKAEAETAKREVERLTQELAEANTVIEELREELKEAAKEVEALETDSKSTKKSSSQKDKE